MAVAWDPRRFAAVDVAVPDLPAGTRGRILQAALALFARYGFHGTTIRVLGAEAGINSATLYGHYPSKTHILAHLVLIGHQELHSRLQEAVLGADGDPRAQLVAIVRAHVRVHTDHPLLALVANAELHALPPEHAAPALALREQSRELLAVVLRNGVDRGVFDLDDPDLAGIALSSMGVRVANWYGPDQPIDADRIADGYAAYALRLVGGTEPTTPPTTTTRKAAP